MKLPNDNFTKLVTTLTILMAFTGLTAATASSISVDSASQNVQSGDSISGTFQADDTSTDMQIILDVDQDGVYESSVDSQITVSASNIDSTGTDISYSGLNVPSGSTDGQADVVAIQQGSQVSDSSSFTADASTTSTIDDTAPSLNSATTKQAGALSGNTVSKIDVSFTESGSGIDSSTVSATDFKVGGTQLDGSGDTASVSGTTVTLEYDASTSGVSELGTGDKPTVALASSISDNVGNSVNSGSTTATDGVKPVVSSITVKDTGKTAGDIDTATVVFSENIDDSTITASNWNIGSSPTSFDGAAAANDDDTTVDLTLNDGNEIDSTAVQDVEYSPGSTADLNNGNTLDAVGSGDVNEDDSATPRIADFEYQDSDSDGKIDQFNVSFSESVTSSNLGQDDLKFSNTGDFTGAAFGTSNDGSGVSGNSTTVQLGTEASAVDTADSGSVAIETVDNGLTLDDGNANNYKTAEAQSQATFSDGAAPIITSATTYDVDDDGDVGAATLTASEAVDGNLGASTSDYEIGGVDANAINADEYTGDTGTKNDGSSAKFRIDLAEGSEVSGTDSRQVNYDGSSTSDGNTNNLVTLADGDLSETDGATPVVESAQTEYLDTDTDGAVERIDIQFSENISASTPETVDFSLSGGDASSLSKDSVNIDTDDGKDEVELTVSGHTGDTDLGSIKAGYTKNNGNSDSLTDGSNPVKDFSGQSISDEAIPIDTGYAYRDTDNNGEVDQVAIKFTEGMNLAHSETGDFNVTGLGGVSITGVTTGSNEVQLTVSGASEDKTNFTSATVNYTKSAGTAGSVEDDSGNANAASSISDTALSDEAKPIVTEFEAEKGSRKATVEFSEEVRESSSTAITASELSFSAENNDFVGDSTTTSNYKVSHSVSKNADQATVTFDKQVDEKDSNLGTTVDKNGFEDMAGNSGASNSATMSDDRNQISLTKGWNLVSTPHLQADDTSTLLNGVSENSVLAYDGNSWVTSTSNMELDEMEAVFIDSTKPQEIGLNRVSGAQNVPPTETLEKGWNLVGPSLDVSNNINLATDTVLNSALGAKSDEGVDTVSSPGYNQMTWTNIDGSLSSNDMRAFEGYWVYMDSQDELAGRTT